jgi:hypothetical protein
MDMGTKNKVNMKIGEMGDGRWAMDAVHWMMTPPTRNITMALSQLLVS